MGPSAEDPEDAIESMQRARRLWPDHVRFSPAHASERMSFWRIQPEDVDRAIGEGAVTGRRFVNGEWRYRIEGPSVDGDSIACVVTFEEDNELLVVITVFRCRRRATVGGRMS